ncbi:MAG: LPXTG cell wall anchor domain-containing protein, partial [Clostridia bacterium]|nr:LPXTG cell wall anchor domain-containing protein [Clostridia bacterium]
ETEPEETEIEPVEIPEEDVPLAELPEETEPEIELPDEEVPLTDVPDETVPDTGDTDLWYTIAGFSAFALAGMHIYDMRKKKEQDA